MQRWIEPALEAYRAFREEALEERFPTFFGSLCSERAREARCRCSAICERQYCPIARGRGLSTRPIFLKIPYFGPEALEQLVSYDSSVVVGILGGSAGTTFDAFQMLWEAKKYGAHAALFGRKINNAEHQLSFVTYLRSLADGEIEPADAVRAYHADLEKLKIRPTRSLADDMAPTIAV